MRYFHHNSQHREAVPYSNQLLCNTLGINILSAVAHYIQCSSWKEVLVLVGQDFASSLYCIHLLQTVIKSAEPNSTISAQYYIHSESSTQ